MSDHAASTIAAALRLPGPPGVELTFESNWRTTCNVTRSQWPPRLPGGRRHGQEFGFYYVTQ